MTQVQKINSSNNLKELGSRFFSSQASKLEHGPWLKCCEILSSIQLLSHVRLFVTPWMVACQASLSMGLFRPEYWSGLPFPSPGDLPDPGIKPTSPGIFCTGRQVFLFFVFFFLPLSHLEQRTQLNQTWNPNPLKLWDNNMPANLENSEVATGLEKVSFHSNPKERQC